MTKQREKSEKRVATGMVGVLVLADHTAVIATFPIIVEAIPANLT